jgi:phosphoenolpyruvate carboxykinase (GTP)
LQHDELFIGLYDQLPKELIFVRGLTLSAIWRAPEQWGLAPETE